MFCLSKRQDDITLAETINQVVVISDVGKIKWKSVKIYWYRNKVYVLIT